MGSRGDRDRVQGAAQLRGGRGSGLARRGFTSRPGAWGDLVLTLPVFLAYQVGVVFLHVRNGADIVTSRLLELAQGDRLVYFGLTGAIGIATVTFFAVLGRGQALRLRKVFQIALEGAVYALAMGFATSWVVGKLFAGRAALAGQGPLAGVVMSLGAGFYEELAFRAILFGVGAKVVGFLFGGRSGGNRMLAVTVLWALACAATFSAMHYLGALGDPFDLRSFVARWVLGLALTLVYATRGFAAAVWTHALYDIWVLTL